MGSVGLATLNIFLSLVLGAIALVFVSIQFPDLFSTILDGAAWVEDQLGHTGLKTQYNNWVRFLIGDEQLTFMFFTIAMRLLLALIVSGVKALVARG
ncbi:MAG: hypothetical protein H6923_00720 [Alphaproteobacteria bacterium]|nr:hypothetical protein [Alphaproteobacteria bacterium]